MELENQHGAGSRTLPSQPGEPIDNVAELQGGDSIQYRILRDFDTAREQKGCVESFVERFIDHP
jgi:hypothetical protein